jgi:hypothetical protein
MTDGPAIHLPFKISALDAMGDAHLQHAATCSQMLNAVVALYEEALTSHA